MKYLHLYLLASLALLASCSKKEAPSSKGPKGKDNATLVDIYSASKVSTSFPLLATGYIESADNVQIKAQVSGKVVKVSPKLSIGAEFKANELLFAIESVDYEAAVAQAQANLADKEQSLAEEEGRQVLAQKEWEFSKKQNPDIANNPLSKKLILREAQLKQAKANVAAAQAQLKQAQLNLKRTKITSPFHSVILDESISLGKIVQVGETLGSLANQSKYQVLASIPQKQAVWLHAVNKTRKPEVYIEGIKAQWVRSIPQLDPITKMAQFLVEFDPKTNNIAIGDFVKIEVMSPKVSDIYEIPKRAIRENKTIWTMTADSTFASLPIEILSDSGNDNVFIKLTKDAALHNELQIINNFLSTPYDGMKLKTSSDTQDDELTVSESMPAHHP